MISLPSWIVGDEGNRACLRLWQLILIAIVDILGLGCLCSICVRSWNVNQARNALVLARDLGSKAVRSTGRLASTMVTNAPETLKASIRHAGLAAVTGAQAVGEIAVNAGETSGRILSASTQGAAQVVPQVVAAAPAAAETAVHAAGEVAHEIGEVAPTVAQAAGVVAEEAVGRTARAATAGAHEIATPQHAGHTLTGK